MGQKSRGTMDLEEWICRGRPLKAEVTVYPWDLPRLKELGCVEVRGVVFVTSASGRLVQTRLVPVTDSERAAAIKGERRLRYVQKFARNLLPRSGFGMRKSRTGKGSKRSVQRPCQSPREVKEARQARQQAEFEHYSTTAKPSPTPGLHLTGLNAAAVDRDHNVPGEALSRRELRQLDLPEQPAD